MQTINVKVAIAVVFVVFLGLVAFFLGVAFKADSLQGGNAVATASPPANQMAGRDAIKMSIPDYQAWVANQTVVPSSPFGPSPKQRIPEEAVLIALLVVVVTIVVIVVARQDAAKRRKNQNEGQKITAHRAPYF